MYDEFHESLNTELISIENNGITSICKGKSSGRVQSAFGKLIVCPGMKYYWKIKLIEIEDGCLCIGVVESDKPFMATSLWWNKSWGYAYYCSAGHLFNDDWRKYGEELSNNGDIIEIWLDLKDDYTMSYAGNCKSYGIAFDMNKSTKYRLAIGMWKSAKRIELLQFETKE